MTRGSYKRAHMEPAPAEFGSALYDEAAQRDLHLPDIDWSRTPVGFVRDRIAVPSGHLASVAYGTAGAPRAVLVPGATGSKEDFVLMMPLLASAGYRVESFDLAGQYESAGAGPEHLIPPGRRYDYELFVDDLICILETGSTPVHVLGYSFAAIVVQLAFVRRPELFASVTLLSCPPLPGRSFRGIKRVGWLAQLAPRALAATVMIWGVRRNLNGVPPGRLRFARDRLHVTRRSSVTDIMGLLGSIPDVTQALSASAIPKLVAVGEHDLWPLSRHAAFARSLNATFTVYRTGHNPCESSPHQLTRDLLTLYEP